MNIYSQIYQANLVLASAKPFRDSVALKANLLIMDDWEARQAATHRGFTVTGLLGILYRAGINDLLDFPHAIFQLQSTTFRASPSLIESFLSRYRQEKR
ncbi:hypothetical protein [Scytonema sp. NUACC26]|uniref:hypothetical protein n=1 Tax=Scytonema sp. NUACC26 TaxID=3140176 RepID=UPI0038B37B30